MAATDCLILCESVHHGNTARVCRAIAETLGPRTVVAAPGEIPYTDVARYGLIGFGSGVFHGRMHQALMDWVSGLPDAAPATPAFVFSTSGLPWLAGFWHRGLKSLLARKGFEVVGEFGCRGFDTWGPLWLVGGLNRGHPDDRDLARARAFARRLAPASRAGGLRRAS